MLPIKKILFPVDFSDRCRGAAHALNALARRFNAEVTPLHVVEDASESVLEESRQEMKKLMAEELKGCRVAPCSASWVVTGDPAVQIVEQAQAGEFDLIVMPTHGHGPFRRFLLGAVTAKVLHDAVCPVWTCAHLEYWPTVNEIRVRNIVCGVDFGPRSVTALKCAAGLADEFGAKLTIVHAIHMFDTAVWSAETRDQARRNATERLHRIEAELHASVEVVDGSAAYGLSEVAEKLNADLMVIGRAHIAADFAKLGSNAYAIITHSPCPVLSV